jgi:hypothetical protein
VATPHRVSTPTLINAIALKLASLAPKNAAQHSLGFSLLLLTADQEMPLLPFAQHSALTRSGRRIIAVADNLLPQKLLQVATTVYYCTSRSAVQ